MARSAAAADGVRFEESSSAAQPASAGRVHKEDVDLLLDTSLIDASVALQRALQNIAGISERIFELKAMWRKQSALGNAAGRQPGFKVRHSKAK